MSRACSDEGGSSFAALARFCGFWPPKAEAPLLGAGGGRGAANPVFGIGFARGRPVARHVDLVVAASVNMRPVMSSQ